MDSDLLLSPVALKSVSFDPLAGPNLQTMLKESADRFLAEVQKESCDFFGFRSVLFRLLRSSTDPPLEVIWLYSAISFHETMRSKREVFDQVFAVKNLLQLLSACSASCGGAKSVALLAPAVSVLYQCVKEEEKVSGKVKKKVRREIESLVEGIVSYISICSGNMSNGQDFSSGCLLPCFIDIIRVWTVQHSGGECSLRAMFPLVSDEICSHFGEEGCCVDYLAGVVVAEAFLLTLSLKVQVSGAPRMELQKELRIWAVSSITVFHNCTFFEIILRLLLNTPLPVISLVSAADESLVRDILYDAVILIDYSFINLADSVKSIVVRRLIVTHEAIQLARDKGDQGKAVSYTNAFSTSCIPSGLIKWATNLVSSRKPNKPTATTPQALLKWLFGLEEQGLRVFEDNISKLQTKLVFEESKIVSEASMFNPASKITDSDLFYFDSHGNGPEETEQDVDMKQMDTAFLSAAHSLKSMASNGRKKRKEWGNEGGVAQVKFVRYKIHNNSAKDYFSYAADSGISSGSEVENPPNDEEMEEQ